MPVIGINPNKEIIAALKEMLTLAERGELTSFVGITNINNEVEYQMHTGDLSILEVIGCITLLNNEMIKQEEPDNDTE